jgi:tetratricopeptide (TPR) repeat protein
LGTATTIVTGLQRPSNDLDALRRILISVEADPKQSEAEARLFLVSSDAEVVALAQQCVGLAQRFRGHLDVAIRWFTDSISTASSAKLNKVRAESKLELAWCYAGSGQYERALELLNQAVDDLGPRSVTSAFNCRGFILHQTEKLPEALDLFDKGAELARSQQQDATLAKILGNRSTLLVELGHLQLAEADLRESVECFLRIDRPMLTARAEHNLGWVLSRRGFIAEALKTYASADARGGPAMAATSTGARDRAELYLEARLFREALHSGEQAKLLAQIDGYDGQIPEIELMIGRAHANLGSWDRAGDAFVRYGSVAQTQGRTDNALLADWCVRVASNDTTEFTLPRVPTESHITDIVDIAFAKLFVGARFGSQTDALHSVVRIGRTASNPTTRIQALISELMMCPKRHLASQIESVISAVENYLSAIGSDELRAVFVESMHLEDVLSSVALFHQESGSLVIWLDRVRGELLRNTGRAKPAKPKHLSANSETSEIDIARPQSEFAIRSEEWLKPAAKPPYGPRPSALTFESIREHTTTVDETLLCYAMTGEGVVLQQVGKTREQLTRLGPLREIRPALEAVRIAVAMALQGGRKPRHEPEVVLNRIERAINRLDTLVRPHIFQTNSISIVTNGLLTSVPWNLLPSFSGRKITLYPSVAEWMSGPSRIDKFYSGTSRIGLVCGPALEHGMHEVESIADLYDDPFVLVGKAATVNAVCELLETVDVAHIVAHGNRRTDSAYFSGIELFDGLLMGYDVAELRRTPSRVILSCCELGAANNSGTASSYGFVTALRRLRHPSENDVRSGTGNGASEVAAPVLLIGDAETVGAMVAGHERLRSGFGLSDALADVVTSASDFWQRLSAGSFNTTGR